MQSPAGRAVGHPLTMSNQQTQADKATGQTFGQKPDNDAAAAALLDGVADAAAPALAEEEVATIDPDSVREEPDVPDIELPNMAAPDVDALGDAIAELERLNEHVWLSRDGETFIIGSQPIGERQLDGDNELVDTVAFPEAAWSENGEDTARGSVFSIDYLSDAIGALDAAKADRVTLLFGDEFPTRIRGGVGGVGLYGDVHGRSPNRE